MGVHRRDRHSNAFLHARCNEHSNSIFDLLATQRLRQLGHVVRMSSFRLPKIALFSAPPAGVARAAGRPRARWSYLCAYDCVRADTNR
jgi:hypothetical protein